MKPLFSLIIPVYNSAAYLGTCMASVLKQTCRDFEVIIVDDGSTDESPEMCDDFAEKDSRIHVIHQRNGGQTAARQAAARAATGRYVACIDSDDWIDENYLMEFRNVLDEDEADIVCAGLVRVSGETETQYPLPQRDGFYNRTQLENEIFPVLIHPATGEGFSVSLCGKIIRRELYQTYQARVNSSMRMGEDLTCFLPCAYHARSMYILHICPYYYRNNPESYTRKKPVLKWDGPRLMMEGLSESIDMEKYDFKPQLNRRILRELFLVTTSQFNRDEKYGVIKQDIIAHISESQYDDCIQNARFTLDANISSVRYSMYSFLLRHRWIFAIKLYSMYLYR